ncbi:MAG: glycosyltransferase [bacterium]
MHSPSYFLRSACIKNGFLNDEFHVISTGISPFKVGGKRPDGSGKLRIFFLGHIDVRKGILDFLKAIELYQGKLAARSKLSSLRFMIYGKHYVEGFFQDVLKKIACLKNTEYRGAFEPDDRSHLFSECDLLVMPSIGENYPFILREALFAGVPVVATDIAGIPEIVQHGKNGFLYPPGDVNALADIFISISEHPQLLQTINTDATKIKLISQEALDLQHQFFRFLNPQRIALREKNDDSGRKSQIESLFAHGKLLIEKGEATKGLGVLSQILDIDPKHAETIKLISEFYDKMGKNKEAQQLLDLADPM